MIYCISISDVVLLVTFYQELEEENEVLNEELQQANLDNKKAMDRIASLEQQIQHLTSVSTHQDSYAGCVRLSSTYMGTAMRSSC